MCSIMNRYLGEMITITSNFSGDVIKFAGDALLVIFRVDRTRTQAGTFPDERVATQMAAACACRLNQKLNRWVAHQESPTEVNRLSLHIGVGCGVLTALHLGGIGAPVGVDRRLQPQWEFVLAGPPMAQLAVAEPLAASGETCASKEAWAHLQGLAEGHPASNDDGNNPDGDFMIIDSLDVDALSVPRPPARLVMKREEKELMGWYIPKAVWPKLDAGLDTNIAEIREVSVLFINCHNLDLAAGPDGDVAAATRHGTAVMRTVQKSVARWEAAVNKMLVDDKGTLIICALGLGRENSHADDPLRAVALALDVEKHLKQLDLDSFQMPKVDDSHRSGVIAKSPSRGAAVVEVSMSEPKTTPAPTAAEASESVPEPKTPGKEESSSRRLSERRGVSSSIGVSSGQAFCGTVGCMEPYERRRREYTMMGDVVNLSARLMGHAAKHNLKILTDTTTYRLTHERVGYKHYEPVKMKGKKHPVHIYKPERIEKVKSASKGLLEHEGRTKERERIKGLVANMHTYHAGGIIVLVGEAGSGKTSCTAYLAQQGTRAGMTVLQGTSDDHFAKNLAASTAGGSGTHDGLAGKHVSDIAASMNDRMRDGFRPWHSILERAIAQLCVADAAERTRSGKPERSEREVVRGALERQLARSGKPELADYLPEINPLIGRDLIVPKDPDHYRKHGYPKPERYRAAVRAKLLVALFRELASHEHVLVILHLRTWTSSVTQMHSDAWKVAHALAHEACNRDGSRQGAKRQPYSLLMCIVSRMSLFAESTREVEEIKDLSKSFASFVVLEPFDEPARLKYLYDVLRKRHGFEGELTDLPQHLIRYVSETAAGVPKHIENLVAALFDKEQLRIEIADAAAGGHKSLVTADPESLANTPVPAKIRAAAVRSYENLTPRHQLLIKLFSPLDAFSIRMIQGLLQRMMTEKKTSGVDYEHVKTDIEDLKKQQCAERPAAGFPAFAPASPATLDP